MLVSRELVEQWLVLGERRIVGASFVETGYEVEPSAHLVLEIEAPDAPEGATAMEPTYRRADDGTVTMLSLGWYVP